MSAWEPQYPHASLLGERPFYEPQRYPQAGENNALIRAWARSRQAGGTAKWLDIGDTVKTYLIARAGWTPDSRQVWIARTNRTQNELEMILFDASESSNWSIHEGRFFQDGLSRERSLLDQYRR